MSELYFQEIKDYVGFEEADSQMLKQLLPLVRDHFIPTVDAFYAALEQQQHTRQIFDGPAQIERLRQTLLQWLLEIFEGPHDSVYYQKRHRIGRVHVEVGLLPHFMFGAMNIIRLHLLDVILASPLHESDLRRASRAFEKILDIELTIMLQSYWDKMTELKLQIPTALAMGLAHEIRNPLNSINLNIALLERRLRSLDVETDNLSPVLDVMRSEIRRIRGMTSEIMDFAKPIEVQPSWQDARWLLDDFRATHGPTLDVSRITLETQVQGELTMYCDLDRLKQVLLNLVTNAVEAIGEEGTIRINILNTDQETRLEFIDTGHGMPPNDRYRIFELFYTTKAAGTGLGLPIVRKIIEAHGGRIDLMSKVGQGTQFTITLPRPASH